MKAKYKSSFSLKEEELNTVQIELKEREEILQKQSCKLEDKVEECSKLSALSEQLKEDLDDAKSKRIELDQSIKTMHDESESKEQKYLQELATKDQQITCLRASVSEKDTYVKK